MFKRSLYFVVLNLALLVVLAPAARAETETVRPSAILSLAPTTGPVPLVVYFTADNVIAGDFYSIDFGDNEPPRKTLGFDPATHVYKKVGAHMVTLSHAENHCPPGKASAGCTQPPPMYSTVSTASVVVTEIEKAQQ